ncbi:MAG: two-component system alkaline phosphatase synthesis response regulator PhoP [Flavobacteriaceae bacterium]|jgi:two-component system alkaline phosphatase synthesis response regulator PhoP
MESVLIIDDEADIRDILAYNLKKEGFNVLTAENGPKGIEVAKASLPDIIILDVMMPEMDGIEVCQLLRSEEATKNILICLLTARSEDYSQIAGLDAGADDYVSKPVKPRVLISRIKAILRRNLSSTESQLENNASALIIDREKFIVIKEGEPIHLPRKEFNLLALLASKPGNVFDRDFILETVWGTNVIVGDRTIDVHIRKLRAKIGDDYIKTVKGVGYKFVEPI